MRPIADAGDEAVPDRIDVTIRETEVDGGSIAERATKSYRHKGKGTVSDAAAVVAGVFTRTT
ncbi:MAG TPA: hypothetical protein VKB96_04260 [Gammaproteobacteria bacterium]|nr:hypothetical protein [Gammaproteobacteria bacterium]